ncbi:MAG: superoxide dismutase [Alphaproteobacteria bacterium]|nr:superoxide dismutase [Alphaproteobacteria bacterium]
MFTLSQFPLPYDTSALAPYMSQDTLKTHHGKHVATYISNLNDLIAGTRYEQMPLEQIVIESASIDSDKKIFNNAAQIYNHNFFFHNMSPKSDCGIPYEIASAFGGSDKFREQFKSAAASVFGSGYTWLVRDKYDLKIITTPNADTPIAHGMQPLMCLDVWEHAYYLDYKNKRADFIDAYLDHLVNWDFVAENLKL